MKRDTTTTTATYGERAARAIGRIESNSSPAWRNLCLDQFERNARWAIHEAFRYEV